MFENDVCEMEAILSGPQCVNKLSRLGRLTAMLVFTAVHLVAGVVTALSVNVWMFMAFRFLVAASIRGAGISGAVLCEFLIFIFIMYHFEPIFVFSMQIPAKELDRLHTDRLW